MRIPVKAKGAQGRDFINKQPNKPSIFVKPYHEYKGFIHWDYGPETRCTIINIYGITGKLPKHTRHSPTYGVRRNYGLPLTVQISSRSTAYLGEKISPPHKLPIHLRLKLLSKHCHPATVWIPNQLVHASPNGFSSREITLLFCILFVPAIAQQPNLLLIGLKRLIAYLQLIFVAIQQTQTIGYVPLISKNQPVIPDISVFKTFVLLYLFSAATFICD
jgi:hypothetical protein